MIQTIGRLLLMSIELITREIFRKFLIDMIPSLLFSLTPLLFDFNNPLDGLLILQAFNIQE